MIAAKLHWHVTAGNRLMRRLKRGRYEGVCPKGKRVRIDKVDGHWELYMGQKYLGKYTLKRTALEKANALLTSDRCDDDRKDD